MRHAFEEFVTIQENRKLTTIENDRLVQPVSMAEVVTARTGINQHKEAGPDGLNNDFYKTLKLFWSRRWLSSVTSY